MPYLLSNFDFVTESLTLIAGNSSVPSRCQLVEAVHAGGRLLGHALDPVGDAGPPLRVGRRGVRARTRGSPCTPRGCRVVSGDGTAPAFSYSTPLWTSSVASPPSSRIMFGPSPPGQSRGSARCTPSTRRGTRPSTRTPARPAGSSGVPCGPTTTAAAASSWVEKMLQRRPADLGAERDEGLDEHRRLHGHVQRAGDARARERLASAELAAQRHQARHLVLGEGDLRTADVGQGQVGNLEVHCPIVATGRERPGRHCHDGFVVRTRVSLLPSPEPRADDGSARCPPGSRARSRTAT